MNLSLENDPSYKNAKKGELIFKEGDHISEVLLIKKGKVLVFSMSEAKVIPLGIMGEKDSLGEEIFSEKSHSTSAYALEDCEFVVIPVEKLQNYLSNQASWVNKILEKLSHKFIATSDVLIEHKVVDDELLNGFTFDEEFEVRLKKLIKGE